MRSKPVVLILLMLSASIAIAGDHHNKKGHGERDHGLFCPRCAEPCYPTVTKAKETRHCWGVETKTICIPRITWPWETWGDNGKGKGKACDNGGKTACDGKAGCGRGKCGRGKGAKCPEVNCIEPKCGRTRTVNVLMKHSYECSVCKYTWDAGKGKASPKAAPPQLDSAAAPVKAPTQVRRIRVAPVVHVRD